MYRKIMIGVAAVEMGAFVLIGWLRVGYIGAILPIGGALAATIYWLQRVNKIEIHLHNALESVCELQDKLDMRNA